MNKSVKNKKQFTIITIIFSIISLIFISTIAYSAFSSTMNITGIAHARPETNVRITDFRIASTNNATSSYEEFGKKHIITNVNFKSESSSITYYLEITNYGSTDVGILNITGLPSGVNYSIKDYNLTDKICNDSGKCNNFIKKTYELTLTTTSTYTGNVQMNFDFRTYHKVTYTDIENKSYPTEVIDGGNLNITFKEDLKRVQVLSNNNELAYYEQIDNNQTIAFNSIRNDVEIKIKERVARLSYGKITEVGSEVCIKDECFYIISNDGSTVTMLSKYNLLVGNRYDSENGRIPLENPTGIQDETAIAWFNKFTPDNPVIGSIPFSSTTYWESTVSSYPAYVYNEQSNIYEYIESYKRYLEGLGAEVNEARPITIKELENLGCVSSSNNCDNAPEWVYSTTYWLAEAGTPTEIWGIDHGDGYFNYMSHNTDADGVRPVIKMSVDEILVPVAKLISGNIGEVGSEICIDTECFYTISSDDETVTMLAKYNLHVGNKYDGTTTPLENPTGIQNETAIGWFGDYYTTANPIVGTKPFGDTYYWADTVTSYPTYVYNENSNLYEYVENYEDYLESLGIISKSRLITLKELEDLGCVREKHSCLNAPSWIYTTTYRTGDAYSRTNIWSVYSNGVYNGYNDSDKLAGTRPVITISKKSIINP